MKKYWLWLLLVSIGLLSCAAITEKGRMDKFSQLADRYRFALLRADYRLASNFVDPADRKTVDFDLMKEIKIVDYNPTHVDVSEDRNEIRQDVELQYFLKSYNILRTTQYQQVWQYQEETKAWQLKTDLPKMAP